VWALGDVCYFLATGALSQPISMPISTVGPPIISTLFGVFIYKEIKGERNFAFLITGFIVALVAAVLIGLSF
jgi:glucose uptake protein GlcU